VTDGGRVNRAPIHLRPCCSRVRGLLADEVAIGADVRQTVNTASRTKETISLILDSQRLEETF